MRVDIPTPHITGQTTREQLTQIIAYLRKLSFALQGMPENTAEAETGQPTERVENLHVEKNLSLEGGVNGLYLRCGYLSPDGSLHLQCRDRQSFLVAGERGGQPLLGMALVRDGTCRWSGPDGIQLHLSASRVLEIATGLTEKSAFFVLSPAPFRILTQG